MSGLIPWFYKTEGNTYATLLHHPFLFKGKPTHAQEVAVIWVEGVAPAVGPCGMWKEEEDGGRVWITCLNKGG